jgi:hypothetical protein
MRRSEIIAREALSTGDAIKRDGHVVERNSYEIAVEDDAHPHVLAICVRASNAEEAERTAVRWLSDMVRKGWLARG